MSRQRVPTSQLSSVNPKVARMQQMGENPRAIEKQRTGENLRATRTHQMGVNTRVKVARSHMLASIESRRHTDNIPTSNDEERSRSRNVFKRLGKGADLRDTLNKRWDQERSQHSRAQKRQLSARSQGVKDIPIEDLWLAIAAMEEHNEELIAEATGLPFCREIREARLPEGFKFPSIKAYEGKSNPQDHLDHFNDLMGLHLVSDMAKCRVFAVTLVGGAKKWLKSINQGQSLISCS